MVKKSISWRITATSVILVLFGTIISLLGTSWFVHQQSARGFQERLDEQLNVMASSLVQPLWSFNDHAVATIGDTYTAHDDVLYLKVYSAHQDMPIYEKVKKSSDEAGLREKQIFYNGQVIGGVKIGLGRSSYRNAIESILWFSLLAASLTSALIIVGIRYFLRIFLESPLTTFSNWAAGVADGQYSAISGQIQEVELQHLAEKFQKMSRIIAAREMDLRKLSMATEQSPSSVIITDTTGSIEYVNRAFENISGYSAKEVLGRNPRLLKSGKTPYDLYRQLWQAISDGKSWQGEFLNRRKNGEIYHENAHITPVRDASGNISHYLAVKEDVTLQKQQEEMILHQAHFDSLTNLPNRFLVLDRLSQSFKEARRTGNQVAVMFLDLDDFKKINDSLGHEAGDRLLIRAAKRLCDTVRGGDTVGRLGGDEFIVLMGGLTDVADAGPVAEKLLDCFRDAFRLDGRELVITASIGIAVYPDDGDNPAELLRNADTAMYHSKEHGRNNYHYFTDAMNQGVSRRLSLEEQLHGALGRNEFYLCYQPLVDIASRTMMGAEALLRWDNPALGKVSPLDFIPIAEHTGLIVPIGRYVITEALGMAVRWQRRRGKNFRISVNLSPRQFRDPDLPYFISESLLQAGLPGDALELEITEGVLMGGHALVDESLADLNKQEVRIALDDFGTGYSSLSYLREYPFDTLKIDRGFVRDITEDPADRELVNAAIAMAHALGLKVVAEGVETEGQLAHLAQQGCDLAQGYLFSKPVSAAELLSGEAVTSPRDVDSGY